MGIYIPNMKMPIDCGDCRFCLDLNGINAFCMLVWGSDSDDGGNGLLNDLTIFDYVTLRPVWCPLKEFDEDLATMISTYAPPFPTVLDIINATKKYQKEVRTLQATMNECNDALEKFKQVVAKRMEEE